MGKLQNKIAVITGGTSGIGLATAKLFHSEGATVLITALDKETLDTAKKEFGTEFDIVQVDVSHVTEIESLYRHVKSKYGMLDILFANAGISQFLPTELVDEPFFDNHFNINVKGVYFTVAKSLPLMNQGGKIMVTSSAASIKGMSGLSVYSATKAAVRSFVRVWAAELAPRQINVNSISPGPVDTPIFAKMKMGEEQMKELSAFILNSVPLHRFGQPEEIAKVALFLASDDASFLTGADIMADGGFSQI